MADHPLMRAIKGCWALLFGMGIVMLGYGLQGPLLGLRATSEGFMPLTTGIIMSGYFMGFVAGSQLTPILIARVGHVRVFAALASIVSVSALLHVIHIHPISWLLMRIVTGVGFSGLYIVAESWLNEQISNDTRGQLLSIYMVVTLGGMGSGSLLLNMADPGGFKLFALVSILFSVALVPILLTAEPMPPFETPQAVRLGNLYKQAPLGVIGCFVTGVSNGAVVGIGAVYAAQAGLSLTEISIFMGIALWGGVLCQWPIGLLSDRFDRRLVLTMVTWLAALISLLSLLMISKGLLSKLLLIGVFGGMSFPMYSLNMALINDYLDPQQMVAASSGIVLMGGTGAVFGPVLAGGAMSIFGAYGFPAFLFLIHGGFGLYAVYRMRTVVGIPVEEQGPPVYLARTSAVAAAAAFESEEGR
jgi:MFS family permease